MKKMNKRQKKKFTTKLGFRTYKYCQEHRMIKKMRKLLTEILGDTYDANRFARYVVYRCRIVPDADLEWVTSNMVKTLTDYKAVADLDRMTNLAVMMEWLSNDIAISNYDVRPCIRENYFLDKPVISLEHKPFIKSENVRNEE